MRQSALPKMPIARPAQWLQDRQAETLNAEYFHVVLTVPERIATSSYQNKRELYSILFRPGTGDELIVGCQSGFTGRRQVHFMDQLLRFALNTLRHFIQDIGGLMMQ